MEHTSNSSCFSSRPNGKSTIMVIVVLNIKADFKAYKKTSTLKMPITIAITIAKVYIVRQAKILLLNIQLFILGK